MSNRDSIAMRVTAAALLVLFGWFALHAQTAAPRLSVVQVTLQQQHDVFQAAAKSYTLTAQPAAEAQVYLNGLLMLSGADYTIAGKTLTFTGQDTANMPAPIVQVWYWR